MLSNWGLAFDGGVYFGMSISFTLRNILCCSFWLLHFRFWGGFSAPKLFEQMPQLIGGGFGASDVAAGGGASSGGTSTTTEARTTGEKKEESDDDMVFSLFD